MGFIMGINSSFIAKEIRQTIADKARDSGISVCELEAEIIYQSLVSDDCDQCHVHWLELHRILESKLQKSIEAC